LSLILALRMLKSLGLAEEDAKVYIYLAKKGPNEEKALAAALKLAKTHLSSILERLMTRGMVSATPEHSTKYSAVELEKVLEEVMKTSKQQAEALQASRDYLLSTWRSVVEEDSVNS